MEFLLRIHCLHFKSDYRVDFYGGKKLVNPGKNLSNNWKQGLRTDSTPVWKKGLGGGGRGERRRGWGRNAVITAQTCHSNNLQHTTTAYLQLIHEENT